MLATPRVAPVRLTLGSPRGNLDCISDELAATAGDCADNERGCNDAREQLDRRIHALYDQARAQDAEAHLQAAQRGNPGELHMLCSHTKPHQILAAPAQQQTVHPPAASAATPTRAAALIGSRECSLATTLPGQ